jgi:hypothetical protein
METIKFVHFGCWNNLNMVSKENLTNTEIVLKKLNETVTDVSFIVIAGDNYYPEKRIGENKKKEKIIHQDKLIKGFNLLPKEIEINMILGNHDLETALEKGGLFVKTNDNNLTEEYKDKCFILKTEQKQQNKDLKIVLHGTKTILNKTLLIMIDTSMYVNDSDDYLPCYQQFHKSNSSDGNAIPNIEKLRKDQEDFILGSIKSAPETITDIIIIGHHPIIGLKMKEAKEPKEPKELKEKKTKELKEKKTKEPKEKKLTVLNDMPAFTHILKKIYRENINYHYLCADLHLYQKGIVEFNIDDRKMKVNQYIVGTGGTELDEDIPITNVIHSRDDGVNYTVSECKKTFGFLECTLTAKNDPIFNFVEVKPKSKQSRTSAGSKNKTKKRKTKN